MNQFELNEVFSDIRMDCQKAACLVEDVLNLFNDATPDNRTMTNIYLQYRNVELKLTMIYDYLSNIDSAAMGAEGTEETHGETQQTNMV